MSTKNGDAAPQATKMEEGLAVEKSKPVGGKQLSMVSKMYDIDGDGELDQAELAMRNMDQTGRGYLTNDKVYGLMLEQLKMQKTMFNMKKVIFALIALVVILALSNLGTSFASATLAKEVKTEDDNMVSKTTGDVVGTNTAADEFMASNVNEQTARKLCSISQGQVECETASFFEMPKADAETLLKKCNGNKVVRLLRRGEGVSTIKRTVCHPSWTCASEFEDTSNPTWGKLCIEGSDEMVYIRPDDEDAEKYIISGQETEIESSDYLHMCSGDSDCESGEVCNMDDAPMLAAGADAAMPQGCNSDSDCSGDYFCVTSANGVDSGICSECNPNQRDTGCSSPSRPACIANGGGGYQCGCDISAASPCAQAAGTCGSPICIPDILPYCSLVDQSVLAGCGTCGPSAPTGEEPTLCVENYDPVCGIVDGGRSYVKYPNQCEADLAGATVDGGAFIDRDGNCAITETTASDATAVPADPVAPTMPLG